MSQSTWSDRYKVENKDLDVAVGVQDAFPGVQPLHDYFVEVSDESRHKQKHHIQCHERFGQSVLVKYVVRVVRDMFLAVTEVVEYHNASCI